MKKRTKVVYKNVSHGYNEIKLHIMKNLRLNYANIYLNSY